MYSNTYTEYFFLNLENSFKSVTIPFSNFKWSFLYGIWSIILYCSRCSQCSDNHICYICWIRINRYEIYTIYYLFHSYVHYTIPIPTVKYWAIKTLISKPFPNQHKLAQNKRCRSIPNTFSSIHSNTHSEYEMKVFFTRPATIALHKCWNLAALSSSFCRVSPSYKIIKSACWACTRCNVNVNTVYKLTQDKRGTTPCGYLTLQFCAVNGLL